MAHRILVPWPGIEPLPPALETQIPDSWTTREAQSNIYVEMKDNVTLKHLQVIFQLWKVFVIMKCERTQNYTL